MRPTKIAIVAVLIAVLTLAASTAPACTWAIGYFYQVTSLKGIVVGTNLPFLHSIRWVRQSIARDHAKLTLYDYRWPRKPSELVPLRTVVTDAKGKFDFSEAKPGHYTLKIDEEKWGDSDWVDVELRGRPNPREFVTIDISPVTPDCKGGHEFIVR